MRLVASRRRGPRNHRRPIARVRYSLGQQENMLPLRKAKAFSCLFLQSKLTAFGFAMEMAKRLVRQKKTFPHVVSTPRDVGESHHHEFGIWSVSVLHASTATASQHFRKTAAHPECFSVCRVARGNFTPSPSLIWTGYSRIIRLVPSHEGCRLPLNKRLLPANKLAHISGDDPPPSLQSHYRTFVATTRQSAPLRRIGTFGLAVGAACTFSLGIVGKVFTFRTGA